MPSTLNSVKMDRSAILNQRSLDVRRAIQRLAQATALRDSIKQRTRNRRGHTLLDLMADQSSAARRDAGRKMPALETTLLVVKLWWQLRIEFPPAIVKANAER